MQTTILKKYFFKRMNNAAVAKAMEIQDIKLTIIKKEEAN